jgi:hypothetical protein
VAPLSPILYPVYRSTLQFYYGSTTVQFDYGSVRGNFFVMFLLTYPILYCNMRKVRLVGCSHKNLINEPTNPAQTLKGVEFHIQDSKIPSKKLTLVLLVAVLTTKNIKYSDLRHVYISNVKSSNIIPHTCKSNHLIKLHRMKFTRWVTNTNDVIFYVKMLLHG